MKKYLYILSITSIYLCSFAGQKRFLPGTRPNKKIRKTPAILLTELPNDMLLEICKHLENKENKPPSHCYPLSAVSQTCKLLKTIIAKTLFAQLTNIFKNLHQAAYKGELSHVKKFIHELQTTYKLSLADIFLAKGLGKSGDTLIHCAIHSKKTNLCLYLIDLYEEYRKNDIPVSLFNKLQNYINTKKIHKIKKILSWKNANPNCDISLNQLTNDKGWRPTFLTLDYLVKLKLWKSKSKTPPLHFALKSGSKEIIRLLLKSGALLHIENHNGRTPLEEIVTFNNLHALPELLPYCNACDKTNALDWAVDMDNVSIAKLLLQAGGEPSAKYKSGKNFCMSDPMRQLFIHAAAKENISDYDSLIFE